MAPGARNVLADSTGKHQNSASSRPKALRQTSLFDAFLKPKHDQPASSSSSPAYSSSTTASTSATSVHALDTVTPAATTSPCLPHASAEQLGQGMDLDTDEDALPEQQHPSAVSMGKRRAIAEPEGRLSAQRARFDEPHDQEDDEDTTYEPLPIRQTRKLKTVSAGPLRINQLLSCYSDGLRMPHMQVSKQPLLSRYSCNLERDAFRIISSAGGETGYGNPFSLALNNGAKKNANSRHLVAVGSGTGEVNIFDTRKEVAFDPFVAGKACERWSAHASGIFDLHWSYDDTRIVTASGDQNCRIWDSETQQKLFNLVGHTATIKSVAFRPTSTCELVSGGRDGTIQLWDTRSKVLPRSFMEEKADEVDVTHHSKVIRNAHGGDQKTTSRSRSAGRSVTSVAYLGDGPYILSSGSHDTTVKLWDTRMSFTRAVNPKHSASSSAAALAVGGERPRGVVSMSLSPDTTRCFTVAMDNKIYAHDTMNLSHPVPTGVWSSETLSIKSFYVKSAVSPDSRYLATGSSDGGVYLVDTEHSGEMVRLGGHASEVCSVDWGHDLIASCSDDYSVRLWRLNNDLPAPHSCDEHDDGGYQWREELY